MNHTSTGEGKARHIHISKKSPDVASTQAKDVTVRDPPVSDTSVTVVGLSKLEFKEVSEDKNMGDFSKNETSVVKALEHNQCFHEKTSNNEYESTSGVSSCESKSVNQIDNDCHNISNILKSNTCTQRCSSNLCGAVSNSYETGLLNLSHNDEVEQINKKTLPEDTSGCPYCKKSIPVNNKTLHELHCSRQNRPSTAPISSNHVKQNGSGGGGGGKGARKKENLKRPDSQPLKEKKEKVKPKTSHVQKASEVLSKIPDDDFDALISTITALDGKCAFRKCKTLTTTLGRQCVLCDRRFCLAHLTPEIHGCGQAAKEQARRTISREGVLHSGSGIPDKKPNAARRAQLELRMEKKKEELAKSRARQGDKKKT